MADLIKQVFDIFDNDIKPYKYIYILDTDEIFELKYDKGDLMHILGLNRLPKYETLKSNKVKSIGGIILIL